LCMWPKYKLPRGGVAGFLGRCVTTHDQLKFCIHIGENHTLKCYITCIFYFTFRTLYFIIEDKIEKMYLKISFNYPCIIALISLLIYIVNTVKCDSMKVCWVVSKLYIARLETPTIYSFSVIFLRSRASCIGSLCFFVDRSSLFSRFQVIAACQWTDFI